MGTCDPERGCPTPGATWCASVGDREMGASVLLGFPWLGHQGPGHPALNGQLAEAGRHRPRAQHLCPGGSEGLSALHSADNLSRVPPSQGPASRLPLPDPHPGPNPAGHLGAQDVLGLCAGLRPACHTWGGHGPTAHRPPAATHLGRRCLHPVPLSQTHILPRQWCKAPVPRPAWKTTLFGARGPMRHRQG